MIDVCDFDDFLVDVGVGFYAGVPDSQLKSFCDFLDDRYGVGGRHIIAANEGNAVALAAGYYLSTGDVGVVYMQNSGLGNAVNPIVSLTDSCVYGIPVVYVIGWRGEPGVVDEPQHVKQGRITLDLLDLLDIDYHVLTGDSTMDDVRRVFDDCFAGDLASGRSVAFVVGKGAFSKFSKVHCNGYVLSREDAVKVLVDGLSVDDVVVSTTGKASRELFEYREELGCGHGSDFLTVGSMGHSSSIALSIALNRSVGRVLCFDGDGALLMHMGALALIGSVGPGNFYHVLFNNGAHETVGGLPTVIGDVCLEEVALGCGYNDVFVVSDEDELRDVLPRFLGVTGPVLLVVNVSIFSRSDLGRPTTTPVENKLAFMKKLEE